MQGETPRRLSKGGRFCWGARGAPGARGEPSPIRFVRRSAWKLFDYQFLYAYQQQSSPRSVSEQMMVIAPMRKIKVPIASAVSMAVK